MKNEYHWFKFDVGEWFAGSIVFKPLAVQGLFINICAMYWRAAGNLTVSEINKRLNNPVELKELIGNLITEGKDGFISIKFMDELLEEKAAESKIKAYAGSKGGKARAAKGREEDLPEQSESPLVTIKNGKADEPPPKVEKPKKHKVELTKEDSQELIECKEVYDNFIKSRSGGVGAKFDGQQIIALKSIMAYVKSQHKDSENKVSDSLNHIFRLWDKLDDFTKSKTTLSQINQNIQNIIIALRNPQKNGKQTNDRQFANDRTDQAIRDLFNK